MTEIPKPQPDLITSADVPGSSVRPEAEFPEPSRIHTDVEFKGDPSRVIGHPSNPNNAAMEAYGESLEKDKPNDVLSELGDIAAQGAEVEQQALITEVPKF